MQSAPPEHPFFKVRGNNISASKPQVLEVMQPIPPHILAQFNNALHQQAVTESAHGHYRKWLRYFLDFRRNYSPSADTSEQLRLFFAKLRAKKQTRLHTAPRAIFEGEKPYPSTRQIVPFLFRKYTFRSLCARLRN
jgi:hypothetical protein